MFCKKADGTTEYTLRFAALLHAESFLLPLSNEILTAYSRDPVVLATEAPSQCPSLGPMVSSAHGRREGLVWTQAGQGQVSLLCCLAGSTIMHLLGCLLEASSLWRQDLSGELSANRIDCKKIAKFLNGEKSSFSNPVVVNMNESYFHLESV